MDRKRIYFTFALLAIFFLTGIGTIPQLQSNPKSGSKGDSSQDNGNRVQRVVSLNGSITEIIYSLGKESVLVGTDTTSYFPAKAAKLPKVGYQRTLSLEGILSLKPDLVIGTDEAGPPEVLDRLRKMGVRVEIHKLKPSLDAALSRIRFVGKNLGAEAKAEKLVRRIQTRANAIQKNPPWKKKPTVLMIYSRGKNMIMVAGKDTGGSAMIELVGAENYVSEFSGYKPLTPEVLLKKKVDVILITEMSLKALGGESEFWKLPGFRVMKKEARPGIVSMDDLLLLGFSDRLDSAMEELQRKIAKSKK